MMDHEFIKANFPGVFLDYVSEWRALADEYDQIPSWAMFRLMRNIKRREQLTKQYETKMKAWGLI